MLVSLFLGQSKISLFHWYLPLDELRIPCPEEKGEKKVSISKCKTCKYFQYKYEQVSGRKFATIDCNAWNHKEGYGYKY